MSVLDSVPVLGGYRKNKMADKLIESAERSHRRAKNRLEVCQDSSQARINELYDLKVGIATKTIPESLDVLDKCHNKINRLETEVAEDFIVEFNAKSLPELRQQCEITEDASASGGKGTTIGAVLALGSGGLGVSGALMVGVAPLLVIGAFKYGARAEENLSNATEYNNEVKIVVAKIDSIIKITNELDKHVDLFQSILAGYNQRLIVSSAKLEASIESAPSNLSYQKAELILLIKSLKRLLSIQLFTADKQPTQESLRVFQHVDNTSSVKSDELITAVSMNEKVTLPNGVKYLSKIEPGIDSPKYFWFQDDYPEYPRTKKKNKTPGKPLSFKDAAVSAVLFFILSMIFISLDWDVMAAIFSYLCICMPITYIGQRIGGKAVSVSGILMLLLGVLQYFAFQEL